MTENTMFQMSADARLLIQHMSKATVGQTITYDELKGVISRPVDGSSGALRTALKRLLRDKGFVFGCVPKVGFKRLNDVEIVAEGAQAADHIRRKAKRSIERQMKADFTKLSREQQGRFTAQVSVMASIAFMSGSAQMEKIASKSSPEIKELPISATLAMFVNG
jgi:hypothetical protein